jgi:hypothetical protein
MIRKPSHFASIISLDLYPAIVNPKLNTDDGLGMIDMLSFARSSVNAPLQINSYPDCSETAPRYAVGTNDEGNTNALDLVATREIVIPLRDSDTMSTAHSLFAEVGLSAMGGKKPGLYASNSDRDRMVYVFCSIVLPFSGIFCLSLIISPYVAASLHSLTPPHGMSLTIIPYPPQ